MKISNEEPRTEIIQERQSQTLTVNVSVQQDSGGLCATLLFLLKFSVLHKLPNKENPQWIVYEKQYVPKFKVGQRWLSLTSYL